jgi:leader peptidase (prepilin peptidase)/N-methyltransferase
MSPVFLLVPAVLLAVGGAFAGSRWIERCYDAEPDILSFPEKRSTQEKQRVKLLTPALALIFCYTLLTTPQSGFLRCALILCYQYFLLISILTRGGIGGGDIKLIALIGLWVGTAQLETIAIAGIVLGGWPPASCCSRTG